MKHENPSAQHIGVISDTHGMITPKVMRMLSGVDLLLHAGDVGNPTVLELLEKIAPVIAVRGNSDRGALARRLKPYEVIRIGRQYLYLLHDLADLDLEPKEAGFHVVISGHTHEAAIKQTDEVLFLNPGSATQTPYHPTTPSVARLTITQTRLHAEVFRII